jgi:PHD/YefM family antitoxin component YafN of YafNO toxin-antitoxin module
MVENANPVRVPEISISYIITFNTGNPFPLYDYINKNKQPQDEIIVTSNGVEKTCKGDYIFVIDSKELPNEKMFDMLHFLFKMNHEEVFYIPRETYITDLTEEEITKNKWVKSENGSINYPDFKKCIYKNNGSIKWENGKLTGYKTHTYFPTVSEYNLKRTITLKEYINEN